MSLLEIHKLSAFYGDFQALFDIDLYAEQGETVAIIGANGSGKSTFLQSIAGGVPVKKESVAFAGKPMGGTPAWDVVSTGIALVPEGRRLFASLTVEENLLMGAYAAPKGNWTLEKVFGLFPKLEQRRSQAAFTLSGGEQQMVAIGRALMSNPKLLMCDELSLGLAPIIIGQIYSTLSKVKEYGMTLLLVEQDIRQAMAVSDRLYCFQAGKVSLEGRPSELNQDQISRAYFGVS
jgi:branched-chain amino acid transport system ATP-binding protein